MENDLRWVLLRPGTDPPLPAAGRHRQRRHHRFRKPAALGPPRTRAHSTPDRYPAGGRKRLICQSATGCCGETCRQAKAWQDDGFTGRASWQSISAIQLAGQRFCRRRARDPQNTASTRNGWNWKLTESAIMENPEQVVGILEEPKALGLRLSIDDFGTGCPASPPAALPGGQDQDRPLLHPGYPRRCRQCSHYPPPGDPHRPRTGARVIAEASRPPSNWPSCATTAATPIRLPVPTAARRAGCRHSGAAQA